MNSRPDPLTYICYITFLNLMCFKLLIMTLFLYCGATISAPKRPKRLNGQVALKIIHVRLVDFHAVVWVSSISLTSRHSISWLFGYNWRNNYAIWVVRTGKHNSLQMLHMLQHVRVTGRLQHGTPHFHMGFS